MLPTGSGQGIQEFTAGKLGRESTLVNAMSQCELFALTRAGAADLVLQVIAVVNQWRTHFGECGVSAADIASLALQIDGSARLGQRQAFRASNHVPDKMTGIRRVRRQPDS